MNIKKYEAGSILYNIGDTSDTISIIVDGVIKMDNNYSELFLEKGSILGTINEQSISYQHIYQVIKPVTLYQYDYSGSDDLNTLLAGNINACGLITYCYISKIQEMVQKYYDYHSTCQFLYDTILEENQKYLKLCEALRVTPKTLPGLEELGKFSTDNVPKSWMLEYYSSLGSYNSSKWRAFLDSDPNGCTGLIMKAAQDIPVILRACERMLKYIDMMCDAFISDYRIDLYTFYISLLEDALIKHASLTPLIQSLDNLISIMEQQERIDKDLLDNRKVEYHGLVPAARKPVTSDNNDDIDPALKETIKIEIRDSISTILAYSGLSENDAALFKTFVSQYIKLKDRSSSDDVTRNIRKNITACFYEIYERAFLKSLNDPNVPIVLKMFFYFGYIDENLAGLNNAIYMYIFAQNYQFDEASRIYTFYDWLLLIYRGKRDPSINEFNVDYTAYLHSLRKENRINEAEESAALRNGAKRVSYEFENMFRSTGKMVSGHVTTFCPVFSDQELFKSFNSVIMRNKDITNAIGQMRNVDFSLFYRETMFSAPDAGITKDLIQVEVIPEIILLPQCGLRGAMWQEITGRKRTSPGRYVLPICLLEDLSKVMVRLCGEFRWELCRRIQGVRWNDISEHSLTSDYCDYLETYKRSHELSSEAKEKIKNNYKKFRNSSKEMFVRDYIDYIQFESAGSLRLNKLARAVLFKYCPFPLEIRQKISTNQIYKDLTERYDVKRAQAMRISDLQLQRIEKSGQSVPTPLLQHRAFLNK